MKVTRKSHENVENLKNHMKIKKEKEKYRKFDWNYEIFEKRKEKEKNFL